MIASSPAMAADAPSPLPLLIKTAPCKLPVKRKTPDAPIPLPGSQFADPSVAPSLDYDHPPIDLLHEPLDLDDDLRPPPFKFHRIWTESDELRFLQGLLDSAANGLVFPRDLGVFYRRFSQSIPQPYTKSQLSEKLRRLRKKFRSLSARLSRGLDSSVLTPHDRALFHLSKQLWDPTFASSSPFSMNAKKNGVSSKGEASASLFHPSLQPSPSSSLPPEDDDAVDSDHAGQADGDDDKIATADGVTVGYSIPRFVMDVFDQSLAEFRANLRLHDLVYTADAPPELDFAKRWRSQRLLELDAVARRLRLLFDPPFLRNLAS